MRSFIKGLSGVILVLTAARGFAFVVVNNADSGGGSLRQAILDANASGGGTISFSGVSGTINLLSALPPLASSIDVAGPGAAQLSLSASGYPIVTNVAGNPATISGLSLTCRETAQGSAIVNLGSLVLSNCVFTNCFAIGGTAGIVNSGALNATNCIFSGNRGDRAADLYNTGESHLAFCRFTNSMGLQPLTGRSVYNSNSGTVTADYCLFASGDSSGLRNASGTMILRNCSVTNNQQIQRGGVANVGQLAVTNCTISYNVATYSSGPDWGGGVYNEGSAVLVNVTVSENHAMGAGGGIFNIGTLLLVNGTIVSNTVADSFSVANGGGVCNSNLFQSENSIFAWNITSAEGPDIYGTFTSLGHNLIHNGSGWTHNNSTDLVGVDPRLSPLQDNGGPTFTHALLPNSPAIDAGDNTGAPATDQRGVSRPQGPAVDIGAFEYQYAVPVFVQIAVQDRTNMWLEAVGLPGRSYTLQAPGSLGGSGNIATLTAGPDGVMQYVEYGYAKYPSRFYRLQGTTP